MPPLKTSYISAAQKSKMVRTEMYILQTRLSKDQNKLKTYLIVRIELSLNENKLTSGKYK